MSGPSFATLCAALAMGWDEGKAVGAYIAGEPAFHCDYFERIGELFYGRQFADRLRNLADAIERELRP